MVQSYKSGRAFRVGLGLSLLKYFVPAYKTFFITLRITTFFNLVGLLIREMQPQLAGQSTQLDTFVK